MTDEAQMDVVIFGAGPAGLAAAHKLVHGGKRVIVYEQDRQVGGISKTVTFQGHRFDMGGHRFFTKSRDVSDLWRETLGNDLLKRPRLSRIYYRRKFFDYPIKPLNALTGLGLGTSIAVVLSYLKSRLFPLREEKTFEQWVSNRFGRRLFRIFFKTYTEKLWGIPCDQIQAEWAAQRIRGLSLASAIRNAFFPQKAGKIKTLIDEFEYPRHGPGMMYEAMAERVRQAGGAVLTEREVVGVLHDGDRVRAARIRGPEGRFEETPAGHFLSSMPITELVARLDPPAPPEVRQAASRLSYRSFLTVSLIISSPDPFPDTWIYVHAPEVKLGRIQNFKSWSPYMVADPRLSALGLEYFCTEGDAIWTMPDADLIALGLEELERIGLGRKADFVNGFVSRVPKAYPVYDTTYAENLRIVRAHLARFANLQPIGRYGMFRYNNMDHSILTGLYAAGNIMGAQHDIWSVNADQDYHEEDKRV